MNEIDTRKSPSASFKTLSSYTSKATQDSALNETNLSGENNPSSLYNKFGYSQLKMNKGSFRSVGPSNTLQGSFTYRC